MADVSQVERQLYILSLLSENKRGFTIEDIMNSLNRIGVDVSRKTVERDIDYVTENFFVYEEEKNKKTYYYANKYSVQNISFTIMELVSLYFTHEVLKSYSGIDVGFTALGLTERIISSTPQINRAYVKNLNDILKVNVSMITHEKNLNSEYLNIIRDAIADRKTLHLEYHSFNTDKTTSRDFDPYLLEIQEGCYHIVGYCHLRNKIRDLRVSRIRNLQLLDKNFIRPENFYETYKKDRFDKLAGQEKIKLKLKFKDVAARYIKEYENNKADNIETLDNGQIIFERNTTMTPEIVKWVLGFGGQVEVLEPQELKKEVIRQANEIIKNYI